MHNPSTREATEGLTSAARSMLSPVAVKVCLDHASAQRFHREAKPLASVRVATIHGSKKYENIGAGFRRKVFSSGEVFRILRAFRDGTLSEDMIKAAFKGINRCEGVYF